LVIQTILRVEVGQFAVTLPWKSMLTDIDVPAFDAFPRQTPSLSFVRPDTPEYPAASMWDFAWASVKLFAPATGAPGFAVFEVATAGVWASLLAGVVCATTLAAVSAKIAPARKIFIASSKFSYAALTR
jgi:hypothetical protein